MLSRVKNSGELQACYDAVALSPAHAQLRGTDGGESTKGKVKSNFKRPAFQKH